MGRPQMSDLLKLENIRKRSGDIKAFPIPSNLIEMNTGKNGWGYIKIAVDNSSITECVINDKYIGVFYLVNREEFKQEVVDG
jgi:hypothetical protein